MEGRQFIVVVALGAIALGWFIGSGAKGFALPKMPTAQPASPAEPGTASTEPDQIDELWANVGQNIGQDPQAAIDTVKAWRDRANSEMEYEPAPTITGTYQPANYTPMSFGPPMSQVGSQPSAPPANRPGSGNVAVSAGFPSGNSLAGAVIAGGALVPQNLPPDATVRSPHR